MRERERVGEKERELNKYKTEKNEIQREKERQKERHHTITNTQDKDTSQKHIGQRYITQLQHNKTYKGLFLGSLFKKMSFLLFCKICGA